MLDVLDLTNSASATGRGAAGRRFPRSSALMRPETCPSETQICPILIGLRAVLPVRNTDDPLFLTCFVTLLTHHAIIAICAIMIIDESSPGEADERAVEDR